MGIAVANRNNRCDFIGNCSGILFRENCLGEENSLSLTEFYGKLREFLRKTRWVCFGTQIWIIGWEELTALSPRNSARAKKLTELGVWNRLSETVFGPFPISVRWGTAGVSSIPSKWTQRVSVANCCWPPPWRPTEKPLKSRQWVLWQHLTTCSTCKHFQALSIPAVRKRGCLGRGKALGKSGVISGSLSPKTAASIYTLVRPFTHCRFPHHLVELGISILTYLCPNSYPEAPAILFLGSDPIFSSHGDSRTVCGASAARSGWKMLLNGGVA